MSNFKAIITGAALLASTSVAVLRPSDANACGDGTSDAPIVYLDLDGNENMTIKVGQVYMKVNSGTNKGEIHSAVRCLSAAGSDKALISAIRDGACNPQSSITPQFSEAIQALSSRQLEDKLVKFCDAAHASYPTIPSGVGNKVTGEPSPN